MRYSWVAAGAVAAVVANVVIGPGTGHAFDIAVYHMAADALLGRTPHPEALYALRTEKDLPFTYPPFAALLMTPLALGRLAVVVPIARALLCFALAGLWQTSLRAAGHRTNVWWLTVLTTASLALEPVYRNIQLGQMSLVIVLLIVADLTGAVPARFRGVLTGVAAGIKLTPLIFIVFLILTRQWRALGRLLAAFAATVLLGFVLLPTASWHYWTGYAYDSRRVGSKWELGDQSLRGALSRLGLGAPTAGDRLVILAVVAVAVVLTLLVATLWWRRTEWLLGVTLVGLASLLASPISWDHHWCWVVPLVVALTRLSYVAAGLATLPYLLTLRLSILFHWRDSVRHWGVLADVFGNGYVWAAALVVAYCGWRLLHEPRNPCRHYASVIV